MEVDVLPHRVSLPYAAVIGKSVTAWNLLNGICESPAGVAERRRRVRTRLRWPILMFRETPSSEAIDSVTEDLSSSGFYCLTNAPLLEGERLICSIRIPTHDPEG